MASFTRPFDPTVVQLVEDRVVELPDPARAVGDPLVRPGIARYAGATLVLLHVVPAGASFALASPVVGAARNVNLGAMLPGGVGQLLEVSPLPFGMSATLRALKPGLPTFYLGYSRAANTPPDDEGLASGALLAPALAGDVYMGLLFQDRVALAPWAWIELLRAAMQDSGDATGASAWNSLASLYAGRRSLPVLDHVGRPRAGQPIRIRIRRASGIFEGPWLRTTSAAGDLEQAVVADPLNRAGGPQPSLFGATGEQTELSWTGDAPTGDTALPVHALYERAASAAPGAPILLPVGATREHLQILDLARWLAPRSPGIPAALARYRTNSRVEPIVDGIPTYKRLVSDLLASAAPGNGAHLAGWAFKNFPLDAGRTDGAGVPLDTTLPALTQRIMAGGGGARFLVWKAINFKASPDTDAKRAAAIGLLALADALIIFSALGVVGTSSVGFLVVAGGAILATPLIVELLSASDLIESSSEQSLEIFPQLNAIQSNIALWTVYPARLADNPLAAPSLPLGLDDFLDQFGAWHQKIQLVKRPPDADGNQYVAYLGGVDINIDRLDTPGHQIASPFHDVHARITGPGAADVFTTWDDRYTFHRAATPGAPAAAFPPPAPDTLPSQPARHIVQIGRTYHRPNPSGGSAPLPFAPQGETTIADTLIRAIAAAREYIHIEDQYFTPNDSQPPGSAATYVDALLAAASTCRRLVILVTTETDQTFGDLRRRNLFARLSAAWGDRVLVGAALRRPTLSNPGRIASEGRCRLMADVTPTSSMLVVGPRARVPQSVPFWLWIDGELMLSAGLPRDTSVGGQPASELDVLRRLTSSAAPWGSAVRSHKAGAPVTLAQLRGIFVHAKVMVVDDIFVSIGSAIINRRGLLHDGEITAFAVPEQLKAAPDNPARALRTALWAEHLGLPPAMGAALLGDPIAAFELFRRSFYEGNRFTPFSALDLKPYLSVPTGDGLVVQLLSATAIGWADTLLPTIWNSVVDPTSFEDPDPTPGP